MLKYRKCLKCSDGSDGSVGSNLQCHVVALNETWAWLAQSNLHKIHYICFAESGI